VVICGFPNQMQVFQSSASVSGTSDTDQIRYETLTPDVQNQTLGLSRSCRPNRPTTQRSKCAKCRSKTIRTTMVEPLTRADKRLSPSTRLSLRVTLRAWVEVKALTHAIDSSRILFDALVKFYTATLDPLEKCSKRTSLLFRSGDFFFFL
jgi:hypothetical protein